MGTTIYREGNTHEFNGMPCEIKVVSSKSSVETELIDGWVTDPADLYSITTNEDTPSDLDDLSNADIRVLAKQLDIENWETCQIKPLKEKILEAQDDSE